jgi:hypothetical protein
MSHRRVGTDYNNENDTGKVQFFVSYFSHKEQFNNYYFSGHLKSNDIKIFPVEMD